MCEKQELLTHMRLKILTCKDRVRNPNFRKSYLTHVSEYVFLICISSRFAVMISKNKDFASSSLWVYGNYN